MEFKDVLTWTLIAACFSFLMSSLVFAYDKDQGVDVMDNKCRDMGLVYYSKGLNENYCIKPDYTFEVSVMEIE